MATCRGCGASAPDLARLPAGAKAVVELAEYKAIRGAEAPFLRWAMLLEPSEPDEAGMAVLQAAWVLDDAGRDAAALRLRAAGLMGEPATVQDALRHVDVLRRAGEFDAAAARVMALLARPGLDETDAALLRYQQGLIAAQDAGRHLLSSALRPPAQRPHVTHGRPPVGVPERRGFWQRLMGG